MPFLVAGVVHNETLLLQTLADVSVHRLKPVPQLRVLIGVIIKRVDGGPHVVAGCAVGESLNKSLYVFVSDGRGG